VLGLMEAGVIWQAISLVLYALPTLPRLPLRVSWRMGRQLLRIGLPLVPSFAFLFVLQHGNKYLLQWMRDLEVVGIYSIGFNFGLVLNLLVLAFQTSWYPYFMSYQDRQDEARAVFGRIFTYYVFGVGSVTLLFFLAARPVVMLFAQPAFHDAYKAVGLSAASQFLIGIFGLLLPGIYFAREVRYLGLLQGAAALVSIGLDVALIHLFGMVGAAHALALSALLLAALQHVQHGWNRRRRYLDVQYEWSRLWKFALLFAGYAAATLWDRQWSTAGLLVFLAVLAILLPVAVYGFLSAAERDAIRGLCLDWGRSHACRVDA
jgi:O-antigen/teichoic acid export membrane protein